MTEAGYRCIDPEDANAKINIYSSNMNFGDTEKAIRIGFEICQRAAQPNVTCWDYDRIYQWAQDNWFHLDWLRPETKFNILETDFKETYYRRLITIQNFKLGR